MVFRCSGLSLFSQLSMMCSYIEVSTKSSSEVPVSLKVSIFCFSNWLLMSWHTFCVKKGWPPVQ